jgi:N-sulfoglucosamine sulfohydrolase
MESKISRRQMLNLGMAFAGMACAAPRSFARDAEKKEEERRPNIVLIVADDLSPLYACYGHPEVGTPNCDRVASEGMVFEQAYVTTAVCSPSRSALLTGIHPHSNGMMGFPGDVEMHDWVRTLPAYMKEASYRTGILGKLHVTPEESFPWDVNVPPKKVNVRDPDAMAKAAREFIEADPDTPFLLMVNSGDPHSPFPSEDHPRAADGITDPDEVQLPAQIPDTPAAREEMINYCRAVRRFDVLVGDVLRVLEETGKDGNTLVVVTGDHGMPFVGAKTTLYEAGLRVPLVVRWPGVVTPGTRTDAGASFVDIVPTFVEVAGSSVPMEVQGRSLVPVLEGTDWSEERAIYGTHTYHQGYRYYPSRSVRFGSYKYIRNLRPDIEFRNNLLGHRAAQDMMKRADSDEQAREMLLRLVRRPKEELYDLERDPAELDNLAGNATRAGTLKDMQKRLKAWMEETDDPLIDLWDWKSGDPDPHQPEKTKDGPFEAKWLEL